MNISIIIFWIIIGALIAIVLDILSQLYRVYKKANIAPKKDTTKKDTTQTYCPHCGSNKTNQTTDTRRMVMVQLPDVGIKCTCFYCSNCSRRWFVELNTFEQKA